MEVVASLSQGRTAAAQCGLFTHKSVPVTFEPPCMFQAFLKWSCTHFKHTKSNRMRQVWFTTTLEFNCKFLHVCEICM